MMVKWNELPTKKKDLTSKCKKLGRKADVFRTEDLHHEQSDVACEGVMITGRKGIWANISARIPRAG